MKVSIQTASHTATGASSTVNALGYAQAGSGSSYIRSAALVRHIQITGTFTATIKLQGSVDGTNWTDWVTGITAADYYIVPDGPAFMRSNCTAFTSGTVVVTYQNFLEE